MIMMMMMMMIIIIIIFFFIVIGSNVINVTLTITSESCTEGKYSVSFWMKLKETVTGFRFLDK